jgi:hypothetical protein
MENLAKSERRRIWVALDSATRSIMPLETAANLATHWQAELLGLFVEDICLLQLTEIPLIREIRYPLAAAEPLNLKRMERELRIQGEKVREQLSLIAQRTQIPWSFQVVRGHIAQEIPAAVADIALPTPLAIFIVTETQEAAQRVERQTIALLGEVVASNRLHRLMAGNAAALLSALRDKGGKVLVLGGQSALWGGVACQKLLTETIGPLFLVR